MVKLEWYKLIFKSVLGVGIEGRCGAKDERRGFYRN
jgi:hypothetical protein